MKRILITILLVITVLSVSAQTKVGGKVFLPNNAPMAYANVLFPNSYEGTITDENGTFYLESQNSYDSLQFSFTGYKTVSILLEKSVNLNLRVVMEEDATELGAVRIYRGKTSKKNNPAIDILRKIWANRRHNGVYLYDQYQYKKYEKLEFDINPIDSSLIENGFFGEMKFIFDYVDTSAVSGRTYLPFFINESSHEVYGDNVSARKREILTGNRNSGFNNNYALVDIVKSLYTDYDVYDNYLQLFKKSFVSPLSRTGIDVYNYVLADSAFIENKWCYKIVYYPRRKNELTFKGDFWVNDTTWAIKNINMEMSKNANINWVNDVYIEQAFDVLNDSTFVITRDHFMSNFAFTKDEDARGLYGQRTTLYDEYIFNLKHPDKFYRNRRNVFEPEVFNRDDDFWDENRIENLSEKEKGIYKMLDTLKTTRTFKRIYSLGNILSTGYIPFDNFGYGPIYSTFGFNEVEGVRLRGGLRTFFTPNDMWRLEAYTAYGFKDNKLKYGFSGKWLIEPHSRLKVVAGFRNDIEQLGARLSNSDDILGRSEASSGLITIGSNKSLSSIKIGSLAFEISPVENFKIGIESSYRSFKSAHPEFSLDFYTDDSHTETESNVRQAEISTRVAYYPKRKTANYGVERITIDDDLAGELSLTYNKGIKGIATHDFDYDQLQFVYRQPWQIGGIGRMTSILELGKTYGEIPLGLLSVVPGNQSVFSINGSFTLLNYYEFVTDTYASLHIEHNFDGRLFSRIPVVRDWNLREVIGFRAVAGSVSEKNQALNASFSHPVLNAPDKGIYWEYSVGVANIFKFFRIDFHFRGSYFDNPDARKFGVTGGFDVSF